MVDSEHGDPGNTREGEPTATLTFPHGLVQLGGDRVTQPGQLQGEWNQAGTSYHTDKRSDHLATMDEASDKYACVSLVADQRQAYQLLPAAPHRRTALIMCMVSPVYLGTEDSVANAAGLVYSTTTLPANVFVLAASNITGSQVIGFEYTSKQGLYVCSASATPAQVQAITERFDSGTPVR